MRAAIPIGIINETHTEGKGKVNIKQMNTVGRKKEIHFLEVTLV